MATTILLIHRQLAFAVSLKQSLERTGAYDVHPFTAVSTAVEYLSTHPQDLAIVDFDMAAASGDEIVVLLRDTQADLPIIATPIVPEAMMTALKLQGCVEARFSAQDVLPLIEKVLLSRRPGTVAVSGDGDAARSGLLTRIIEQKKTDVLPKTRERKPVPPPEDNDLPPPPDPDMPATALGASDFGWAENDDEQPGTGQLAPPSPPTRQRAAATSRLTPPLNLEQAVEDFFAWPEDDEPSLQAPPPEQPKLSTQEAAGLNPSELFADFEQWTGSDESAFPPAQEEEFGEFGEISFDALLAGLNKTEQQEPPPSRFSNLMDTMRPAAEEKPPLPSRQPYVELNLTNSMDSLVGEIERRRAASEPPPDDLPEDLSGDEETRKRSSEQLEEEEPPEPGFEDSGTVGDLFTGVNETGFQNVLSILRGEPTRPEEPPQPIDRNDTEDFLAEIVAGIEQDYGLAQIDTAGSAGAPERTEYNFDTLPDISDRDEADGDTPARIILQKATSSPEDVSIDQLLQSIEEQLPEHRPKVRPLPSWREKDPKRKTSLIERLGLRAEPTVPPPDTLPEPVFEQPSAPSADLTVPSRPAQSPAEAGIDFDSLLAEEFAADGLNDLTVPSRNASALLEAEAIPDFDALFEAEPAPDDFDALLEAEPAPDDFYDQTTIANASLRPAEQLALDETEMLPDNWAIDDDAWATLDTGFAADDSVPAADYAMPADAASEDAETLLAYEAEEFEPGQITPIIPAVPATAEPAPPAALPEMPAARLAEEEPPRLAGYDTEFDRMATFAFTPVSEEAPALDTAHIEDPYIAQLALSLTDVSLELTADGSLLSRAGEIVAYAGRMARAEMSELREILGNDWDARPDEARIRFVNLPASGKDYMVYTRRTIDDLSLTLIFSGETPLRDIRQQGKRLIEALRTVPETPEPPPAPREASAEAGIDLPPEAAPIADVPRTPFAYVWLLREPDAALPRPTAQAIVSGLSVQLREQAWQVHDLRAAEEYVYVLADVPGEAPPQQIARELKQRAGLIASTQNRAFSADHMWAESYLVVTPGRPLEQDEIQQFIAFERMF